MIVVRFSCGLGNQLFQYAAARALARLHLAEVRADVSWFAVSNPDSTPRAFELGSTRADLAEVSKGDGFRTRMALRIARLGNRHQAAVRLQRLLTGLSVYREPRFEYTEELFRQPDNVVVVGQWQSERYTAGLRSELVREIVPRRPLADKPLRMAERIGRSRHPVCLQVRRGDYVSSPTAAAFHDVCPPEYYESAARMILDEYSDAEIFVFSDEPDWCRKHLDLPGQVEIASDHGSTDPIIDLYLMTCCKSHVISNSTYGWWGAWLSGDANQMVICPERWFKDDTINTRDLLPASWRRL